MLNLPSEIHHMIAGQCELVDIAAVSTTCRQLHQVYNVLLYEQNVKFHNSSALRSICQYKEQRFSVAALKNAISAGANLQRTFYKVVTHTLPRQYSWSRPGFDQIAYVHYLTPLHLAASAGLCDAVTLFLDDGIDVDVAAESLGWTPLFFALNKRRDRTARRLIDQGASLILGSGLTALHMAVAANLRDISTYLINDKGMDLNSGDRNGDTPLVYALTSPYTTEESILHLLTLGADANKRVFVSGQCWSPLSISLRCGRWDFAEKLLDHGADVEGTSGLTISHPDATRAEITHPLLLALFAKPPRDRRSRKRIITRLLAKADPKMEVPVPYGIGSLLSTLVYRKLRWEIKLLLGTWPMDVETRDCSGLTPLGRALSPSAGSPEIAAVLLRHGARIPEKAVAEILRLVRNICQTPYATVVKETLNYNKTLGPMFQLLFNHCSSLDPEDRDAVVTEFLIGCPAWMVDITKELNGRKLTNNVILDRMKDQFEIIAARPRKASPPMKKWWMYRNVKRRQLNMLW